MPGQQRQRRGRKYQKRTVRSGYKRRHLRMGRAIHSFKREVVLGQAITSISSLGTVTNVAQAYNFKLEDIPNYQEYQALYDQYKFTGIKFKVLPKSSNIANASNSNTVTGFGQVITCIDYDDSLAPLTKDEILQFQTAKSTGPMKQHHRYFTPKMLNLVYRTTTTNAYNTIACKWLDMGISNVPTFGIKLWIDGPQRNTLLAPADPNAILQVVYDIHAVFYFKCKNTR